MQHRSGLVFVHVGDLILEGGVLVQECGDELGVDFLSCFGLWRISVAAYLASCMYLLSFAGALPLF
jgi:hypothetical protein